MKNLLLTTFTLLILLLTTNGVAALAAEPIVLPSGTLGADELQQLFPGKTVESFNLRNNQVSLSYYDPNGTVRQLRKGKIRLGKWNIKENGRICLKMENERNKCRIVVLEQDIYRKYVVKKSGKHKHVINYRSFISGNPHNL